VNGQGNPLGRGYARHALIERSTGAREQEPQWWVDALRIAVKEALASAGGSAVKALGVSGQQHGLVILDENLEVIRPAKLWNDTETAEQNAELVHQFGGPAEWLRRFGIVPLTGYTLSKLLWLKQNEPQNFVRIRHILLPHDYLNFWLTGRLCAEAGDASGTAFFDIRTLAWQQQVLNAIDDGTGHLFAALPELIGPEDIVGTLRPEVAAELRLPETCLVSSGGGDNMMAAIGTGNVREGIVTLSLGTSSTVYSFSEQPVQDETGSVAPFCSSSGGWLPLICTMNATNVVTDTAKLLGQSVAELDHALNSTEPGADGLTFLPFLNGERTPDLPRARASLVGISATNFTANHLIRAAVEGVSFGILNGLDLILHGRKADVVQVTGGGARSAAWRQLLADASGVEIHVPAEEEAGCLGAAMQAMVALSRAKGAPESFAEVAARCTRVDESATAKPRFELRESYNQARARYNERLRALYGV
jgi:xylulokinase